MVVAAAGMGAASTARGTTMWRFRRIMLDGGGLHLAFGTCSTFSELHKEAFRRYAMIRHHDLWTASQKDGREEVRTIAILLTPCYEIKRMWDTTLHAVQGDLGLSPEDLEVIRKLWEDALTG